MWTRHEGQREFGIGSEWVVMLSTQPPLGLMCQRSCHVSLGGVRVGGANDSLWALMQKGRLAKPEQVKKIL